MIESKEQHIEAPCEICGKPTLFLNPKFWAANPSVPICGKACKTAWKDRIRTSWAAFQATQGPSGGQS